MREVPVYLFLGFLDGGKTSFIQQTLEDGEFNSGERTLLLLCEQGELQYAPERFAAPNVDIVQVSQAEELTPQNLDMLDMEQEPERVIIEYNGMWPTAHILDSMPESWVIYQCMLFADAASFPFYDQNMRPLVGDKLTQAETVIFNRYQPEIDKERLHRIVRSVSRNAFILYEYPDGHTVEDTIVDPLPYDLEQDVITVKDDDYAIFYRDIVAEPEKYQGKVVKFRGEAARSELLPEGQVAIGRFVMTCCVEDIGFCGFVAKWHQPELPRDGSWVMVGARVKLEDNEIYGRRGPVLYVLNAKNSRKPKQEVATFY